MWKSELERELNKLWMSRHTLPNTHGEALQILTRALPSITLEVCRLVDKAFLEKGKVAVEAYGDLIEEVRRLTNSFSNTEEVPWEDALLHLLVDRNTVARVGDACCVLAKALGREGRGVPNDVYRLVLDSFGDTETLAAAEAYSRLIKEVRRQRLDMRQTKALRKKIMPRVGSW